MKKPGPPLQSLTHRLASAPEEILMAPLLREKGKPAGIISTAAVISDLMTDLGSLPLTAEQAAEFDIDFSPANQNYLKVIQVACYLLHAPWFLQNKPDLTDLIPFFRFRLEQLSAVVPAENLITDSQHREELVRVCLWGLNLIPEGESLNAAQDRLTTLDSAERERLIQETRAAQERARKVREEIARRQMEEEMASKMSRE